MARYMYYPYRLLLGLDLSSMHDTYEEMIIDKKAENALSNSGCTTDDLGLALKP